MIENLPNEEWRDIEGYEGLYQVSNMGRVKNFERMYITGRGKGQLRFQKEIVMKLSKSGNGYLQVKLCKDGSKERVNVHRLVANAFIPNPDNLPEVNHKIEGFEGKSDNRVENLEWCTRSYNTNYGTRTERMTKTKIANGIIEKQSKKVIQIDLYTNEVIKEWSSLRQIERDLGFSHSNISACCKGEYKQSNGYKWKFKDE